LEYDKSTWIKSFFDVTRLHFISRASFRQKLRFSSIGFVKERYDVSDGFANSHKMPKVG